MTFDLHYGATPSVEPGIDHELTTPPALRLLNPEPDPKRKPTDMWRRWNRLCGMGED